MTVTDAVLVAVVVVLLFGSGILALAETSLVRTSRVKARALEEQRRRGAKPLVRLVQHPERFLNPVLLMVLVCQLVSATLIGILADHWFGGWGVLVATVFEVLVIFVFFEAVPKNWAVHNPERAALFSAPVVDTIVRFPPVRVISGWLIGLADFLIGRGRGEQALGRKATTSDSELRAMADVAHDEDVIETGEREFIHSVIDFGDMIVREVMSPRPDMVTLVADTPVSTALEEALTVGYSRLPVHEQNLDDVVGIAYTKDLVRAEHDGLGAEPVRQHARPAVFVPETKHVSSLLREMQDRKFHQAVVVDEYGGTAGLVTLEDLLEELVGEIVDEFDKEEPEVERRPDGSVVVNGNMAIDDVDELFGTELPQSGWDTVGGLVLDLAGHVPAEGEVVAVDGLRLVAEEVQGRRIERVRILRA
jgi:putative hemolysin